MSKRQERRIEAMKGNGKIKLIRAEEVEKLRYSDKFIKEIIHEEMVSADYMLGWNKALEEIIFVAFEVSEEDIYRLMDGFLVEGDKPRSIDRLNTDRHLFVENILDLLGVKKK